MSNKSESIAKLALALSKLQGEVTDATKDKAAYNYSYADLAGVLCIARPLLLKHELAVSQLCTSDEIGVGVTTVLMHSSGEWIESTITMPTSSVKSGNAAQAAGSIITYARRYALAAILGITQTDNDAEACAPEQVAPKKKESYWDPERSYATLAKLIESNNLQDKVTAWCQHFKVESLKDLSDAQMQLLIDKIKEAK